MKTIDNFLQEKPNDLKPGDIILIGKWRNRKATIKGFDVDPKTKQPIIKTDKGKVAMHPFRVNKLLPKRMQAQNDLTPEEAKQ